MYLHVILSHISKYIMSLEGSSTMMIILVLVGYASEYLLYRIAGNISGH